MCFTELNVRSFAHQPWLCALCNTALYKCVAETCSCVTEKNAADCVDSIDEARNLGFRLMRFVESREGTKTGVTGRREI